jgi:hypothetical protein
MREILLVSISALLGYIIFSAFSSTSTSEEAFRKILEQPHNDVKLSQEMAFQQLSNDKEANIIKLDNAYKKDQLETYQNIKINEKENNTKVEIKEIDARTSASLATIKVQSDIVQKKQDNYTYLAMAFLLFLIVVLYLRYQKNLAQLELNQKSEESELHAKKEYAEKILTLLASGNLTFETERKLLKVLDELNGHHVEKKPDIIYHPNPEIAQISNN